eukprot:TRINITY_DN17210_c0_g1_i1.p2 TRINITY_DN17210_c0_g1~~TRINITY_DN17210_c0_g1_i1.p2  ORF type:complete len:71 (-),score=6.23 TRINITY_DN17210_c0_g1_i1:261-473(-)
MTTAPDTHNGPGAPETPAAPTAYASVQVGPVYATPQSFSGQHTLVALQAGPGLPQLPPGTNPTADVWSSP